MASREQSMAKSVVWRILGVFILTWVTYFFTGNWAIATNITVVHHVVFLFVFYFHERLWDRTESIILWTSAKWLNVMKAFTYEIILGMGLGSLIVYYFTGSFPLVTQITGTYTVIKLIMYYFYDQI